MNYGIWIKSLNRFRSTMGVVAHYPSADVASGRLAAMRYVPGDAEVREIHNNNCGGGHCVSDVGEVRVMPLGGGANQILCYACFTHENRYRALRARETGAPEKWPIVAWHDAAVYDPGQ